MLNKKGGTIFYLLFIIAAILIVGLIIFYYSQKDDVGDNMAETQVDLTQLAENYKNKVKDIMPAYKEAIEGINQEKLEELRVQLLSLKMPSEFKDLHVELILLLDKLEQNYSSEEAQKKLEEIISQYNWLK
ncbi:MAG: hypothetical protein WC323_00285 [Patescibacteria group bacterium]|jgi:hypothetical protein